MKIAEKAAARVIEPGTSPCTELAVLVKKKDQTCRSCVYYQALERTRTHYPTMMHRTTMPDPNARPYAHQAQVLGGGRAVSTVVAVSALDPETKALYLRWPHLAAVLPLADTIQTAGDTAVAGPSLFKSPGTANECRGSGGGPLWDHEDYTALAAATQSSMSIAVKGPGWRSHILLKRYQVGAPMEWIGLDILGPFSVT